MKTLTENSFITAGLSIPHENKVSLSDLFSVLSEMKNGLVINSGPTGSGKSFSQMRFLNHLNENRRLKIFTVEDPIEYLYSPIKSQFKQYEVGVDTPSFATGAKALAAEYPDVLQIAEIRDAETLAVAIDAASKMLVVTSHHMTDAEDVYERIVDDLPIGEVEDLLDDLAALPIFIIHHRHKSIQKVIKLDPIN